MLGVASLPWFVKAAMGIHGIFLVITDVYPVLLQRKNRIRAERIMGKLIERKKAWTADPTRIRAAVDEALKSDTRFGQNIQYERYGDRPLASGYQAYRIVSADERSYGESREDFLKRQFDALVAGGRLVLVAENAEELLGFKDLLYEIAASPGGYLDSFRVLEDPKRLETDWGETYFAVLEKKAISWFPQDEIPDSESPVKKMGLKEIPQTLSGRMPDTKPVEELFERVLSPATRPALERFMDRIWFAISHGRIPADEQEFWFKRFFENLLPSDEREFKNYLEEVNSFFDEIIALFGTEGQEGRQLPAVLSEAEWLLIKVSRNRIYPADDESAMTQAAVFIRQFRALWRRSAAFAEGADRARMLRETLPVLIRLAVQLQAVPKRGKSLSDDYNWMGLQSLLSAPEIRFDGIVYRRANVYAPYGDGDHAFAEGKNPIFQMELVNPENGERLYLLAKLLDRGSDHDVIYQTSAKLLGLPSYRVETYREPFAVPWQLIEYVPAGPIAATVQKQIPGLVMLKEPLLEFDASRVESFLAKDQEDAAGRLRELGGHLALEDLLGARDSTMKHFLLAREGVPRIVKIDTEYLLDYGERSGTNIPRPLEPSSDVMKFVKMLEEHPKKTVWLKALEDGFNRVKENARAQIGVIEEIIRSRDVPYPPEKSEALRGRASRTFEELRRSYSDAPPRAEMRGDLPAAALELANALNEYAKGVPGIAPHIPLHELLGQMSGGQLHGLLGGLLADIPELTDSDQPDGLMKAVYQSVKEINRALKADTNVMIVFFKAESGAEVMGKKVPETPHFAVVDRREIERHIRELGMSSQGRAERVLVAEDDDKLTKTYQRWADFIKTTGLAEFDVVEDGKKGLEKLRESERAQKRTDLILSDVDMPGMDGIEMVESYRKESKGPAVPVVWVTGRNMREMGDAKDWDRTTYVGKPSLWHQTLLDGHFALLTGILMGLDEGGSGVSGIRSESRISGDDLLREKGDKIQSLVRFGIAAVLRPGMDVLEMGIGSGVLTDELTDMADSRGVRFTGIDLNPEAVRMSKMLFEEKKKEVRVLEGDLFSPLEADEQFDVVSWNPPWYFDGGGKSLAKDDPGFRTLKRFLEQAPRFLKPGGKLFLIMPEESMAAVWDEAESFFDIESKAAETTKRRTVRIYELTPRAELPAGFTQVSETAGVVVDALRPDVNTNLDRSELRQVYEFARSDFDGLVGEITKLAGAKIEARRAELREEGRVAPNLSQSWVEQSQALFDWWKRGIESQKPPIAVPREQERGAMTLAIRLGNAEEHDSFLAQLLKVLGAQERKTTLFSDKTSQRYVAKAIGAHGLKSVISSVPMGARDIKTGVSELHRKDQPDVPIGLLDGTDAVEELSDTFVGVALEEGETPPDPDVIFHNELLFAIILCLMPEMIGTEAYREEVRAKTERLPVEEKGRSDKIKEIKAETLKAALLKQLEQLGYTAEIFSSQSAQFLTLNGAQIARMITEIRARAEIRKAA
jgi:CheY-like chemotaxis protein/predicted methyltransferase